MTENERKNKAKLGKSATGGTYISMIYSVMLIFPYPPLNNYCLEYTPMPLAFAYSYERG